MSDKDKNINSPETGSLEQLFDAFGGYSDENDGESEFEAVIDDAAAEDDTAEDFQAEVLVAEETGEFTGEEIGLVVPEDTDGSIDEMEYDSITSEFSAVIEEPEAVEDEPVKNNENTDAAAEDKSEKHAKVKNGKKHKKDKKKKISSGFSPSEEESESVTDLSSIPVSGFGQIEKSPKKTENNKESSNEEAVEASDSAVDFEIPKPTHPGKIIAVLTAICAAVALLLATVNNFTAEKIADNTEKAMLSSIREIFDSSVEANAIEIPEDSGLSSAYLVIKNGGVCGYAASVAPNGFGGPLNLMVGVNTDGSVIGVEVVSMSETPGLGSRVGNSDFLAQFKGKSGEVSVDVISGASISSKAVIAGVNSVTAKLIDISSLAAEKGMQVVPYGSDEDNPVSTELTVTDTEAPVTTVTTTTAAPATEAPAVVPEVTKVDVPPDVIVPNPNNESPGIYPEFSEGTIEYETMTTEPGSTDVSETVVSELTGESVQDSAQP